MMFGVVAGQGAGSASYEPSPPVVTAVATSTAGGSSTSHTIPLPEGWQPGDLAIAITCIGAQNTLSAGSSGMSGWTQRLKVFPGGNAATLEVWTRVLQSDDSPPTILSTVAAFRATRVLTIGAGTFKASDPVSATTHLASGTSAEPSTAAGSVSHAEGSLILGVLGRRGVSANTSVTAYPFLSNQGFTTTGTGAGVGVCTTPHAGGVVSSAAWTLSGSSYWAVANIIVIPPYA